MTFVMDYDEMRRRFTENLNVILETKRNDNKALLNVDEYNNRIAEVKEAKTLLLMPGAKKSVKHYRMVAKYDVMTINGKDRLIQPVDETVDSKVLYYVTNGELFDIIHNAHLAIRHGGRNLMVSEISKRYCNITKETIMIYLRLCTQCQKKSSTPKRGLVSKPILHSNFNSRAQVDLIDMQSQSYNDYRFIMVYQDHLTKFVLLKPLKSKRAEEVAFNLLKIFTTFGAPLILHSDNGREFVNSVLVKLHAMWPEVKIVHGKPRHSQSQESVERANRDIKEMLGAWMDENKTKDWPAGMKFIQFKKNRALHSGIGRSPYEAMFGCPAKVGLALAGIPQDEIINLATEEDVEGVLKEMGESIDRNAPNSHSEIKNEENTITFENDTVDAGSFTEYKYEERVVCDQCCTPLGEEANDGKCLNCERQGNIERKRSRGFLEKQANKMLKLSNQKFSEVQVGTTVRVPIPDVNRARGSPRNALAVVSRVEDGLYKLCTPHGVLKHMFTRSEFNPCIEKFILLENLSDSAKNKEISLREVAAANSILGGQGYKRCHCKGGCKNNKCACRAHKRICNSKCHGSRSCQNKEDNTQN